MTHPTDDPLREALEKLHHAVCGETGFAAAVRQESGKAYPWPALDIADELARAALAAAPQPAPDRESLMEMIAQAQDTWSPDATTPAAHIADALLARGLRLPGVVYHKTASRDTQAPLPVTDDTQAAPEALAWAVLHDRVIVWIHAEMGEDDALAVAQRNGGRVVRVAIRVVEGGDDE